ncbi:MAG: TonB-dependent receptor [Nevskiaceae bacterium]|jgi:iron complex outermembrane receptor protein|nr:TonB-dependent receptor [Nevskiaceae bacterium]
MKLSTVSLAVAAVLAASAHAQAQNADDGGLPEIVVTAQKRAENVQDVPIAISVFDSAALKERSIGNVSALSNITPNVTLDASTPFSGSSAVLGATIRGIGSSDFAFNIDPAVGVYLDGVYLGRSIGANQDLLDVERIEVLKGPQGTLFGRNSVGGAISIVTRDPGNEFAVTGDVTVGSFNRLQVRGMVELPLIDNALSSSLAFSTLKRDGFQKRVPYPGDTGSYESWELFPASGYHSGLRQGGDDSWNLRGKLRWNNGGALRATLTGDLTRIDQESTANTVLAATPVPGPFAGLAENNIPGTALDVVTGSSGFLFAGLYNFCIGATAAEIAARNAQLVCGPRNSVAGYQTLPGLASRNVDADPFNDLIPYDDRWVNEDIDKSWATGNDFSKLQQGGIGLNLEYDLTSDITLRSISSWRKLDFIAGVDLDNSPLPILQTSFTVNQQQWSEELQLTGSLLDNSLNFVVGGYVFNEKGDLRDFVTFAGGLLQVDGPGHIDTTAYALFSQIDWRVNDLLGFTLGGRWTREDKGYDGAQSDVNGFNYKLFDCMDLNAQGIPTAGCAQAVDFPIPDQPFRYYPFEPSKQDFNNFSFKAGVQVYPTDDVMLYGSFSQGYKTGGWTTRLSNPLPVAPTFGEEKAGTWELGVKSTLIERRLQLNAAAFSTQYKGIQLNFQEGVSPTVQNAGNARINGFEVETLAAPVDNFTITASLGYLDAYYTSLEAPAQVAPSPFQLGVAVDSDLPKAPHWKFNVSPRLELPVSNGSVVLLADWTHTASMRNDTEGTILMLRPSTDMFDASVGYYPSGKNWNVTVGGTNLSDERYIITGQAQIAGGVIYGTYNRPREWYMRLGFDLN